MSRSRPDRRDPRGGHVRIYWSMLSSPAWQALSHIERSLYISMRRQLKGSNNGDISATVNSLRHDGFTSSSTLFKSLRAPTVAGFIDKSRQGMIAGFSGPRCCNLYRFTDEPVYDIPKKGIVACKATNDWQNWSSKAEVEAAITAAHVAAKRPNKPSRNTDRNDTELRPANRIGSNAEAKRANVSSLDEYRRQVPVRRTNLQSAGREALSD